MYFLTTRDSFNELQITISNHILNCIQDGVTCYIRLLFFCYGSTTSRPYPAKSLPAQLCHRSTDEVFVWAPTQPIYDKDLDVPRFEPGSPN